MGLAGFGPMHQGELAVLLHGLHEGVADTDRDVEVFQVASVLGMDELFNVGMIATQNAHLRAPAGTGGLNRFAGAVKHTHVTHRP